MSTLTGLKIKHHEVKDRSYYRMILVIRPEPDSWLDGFCKRATRTYLDSYVITDLEAHQKTIDDFKGDRFVEVCSELNDTDEPLYTMSPEYQKTLDSYKVYGKVYNFENYCLSYNVKHNCYIFKEYFVDNSIVRACITELQTMYVNQAEIDENELTRLLATLTFHWD